MKRMVRRCCMDKKVMTLIGEGKYAKAAELAEECIKKYLLNDAEEIYEELYDRTVDEKGRSSEAAIQYMRRLAVVNYNKGNYNSALSLNNAVLEWCSQNNYGDSRFALEVVIEIGQIYSLYNRYENQYDICRKALDISINTYGENDKLTCELFKNLADSCVALYKYDEAMMYYERVLSIYESDENADAEKMAFVYDAIAYVYKYRGLPQKAKEYFEKGIAVLQSKSDEDCETLLLILNDLCNLYNVLSMLDEALELRKSIFERAEKLYGFNHPNVCVAKSNLADAYNSLGEYDTAEKIYKECLQWTQENLGEKHCETVRNEVCLSSVYREKGKYDDAMQLIQSAYNIRAELLGDKHIDTVLAQINMAYCYSGLKNFRAAKNIFRNTVKYFENENDKISCFYAMGDYYEVCILMGEYSEALDGLNKLLKLSEAFDEHVVINDNLSIKTRALKGLGRYNEALECQKKVIELFVEKYGKDNPHTLNEKVLFADVLFDMGEYKKSAEMLEEITSEFDKRSLIIPEAYKAKILLARNYSALSEYDKASEIIGNLLETMDMSIFCAEYSDACYAAAENFKNMKQYDKALEYAEKTLVYRQCIYEEDYIETKAAEALCEEIKGERKK